MKKNDSHFFTAIIGILFFCTTSFAAEFNVISESDWFKEKDTFIVTGKANPSPTVYRDEKQKQKWGAWYEIEHKTRGSKSVIVMDSLGSPLSINSEYRIKGLGKKWIWEHAPWTRREIQIYRIQDTLTDVPPTSEEESTSGSGSSGKGYRRGKSNQGG